MIPGIGCERNARFFLKQKFQVSGLKISKEAIRLGQKHYPEINFKQSSVTELEKHFQKESFDLIYCFNVLHLFTKEDRLSLIKQSANLLKPKGIMAFIVFSEQEESFGKGEKIEENTFKFPNGKILHYFEKDDLSNHFKGFKILENSLFEDKENHGNLGKHTHRLRLIVAQKS